MIALAIISGLQLSVMLWLLADRRVERRESMIERSELLQRIQAPDTAVYEHSAKVRQAHNPEPLPFDDDEAFHATREQLAAALANEIE